MDLLMLLTVALLLVIAFRLIVIGADLGDILKVLRAIHLEQIRGRK
jgi:hypothetical protein